jgi:hypothetical protein
LSNFEKKTWETGETITAGKLNRMEEGIAEALSEAGKKVAGSGWNPDKHLGTDEHGNVVEKEAPATGDIPKNVKAVKEGNTVTLTYTMESGKPHTDVITFGDDEYPTSIVADGVEIPISWEGFDT